MAQYLDLEKAIDYLIDETPEGAPFREGKVFVRGHFVEKKADPPQPPHVRGSEVIRIGINGAGEATIWFRPENPADRDREVRADLYRLSVWQPRGLEDLRRRFALPLIVRACAEGRWKADGKEPGSAKREDILARGFIGSEIDQYTGDLMSTPGSTSTRPENAVAIWTELMFSVPDVTPQPERISQAPPPIEPLTARSRFPSPAGRPDAATGGTDEGKGTELSGPAIHAAATPTKAATKKLFADLHRDFLNDKSRPATVTESYELARSIGVRRDRARELRRELPSHLKNKRRRPSQK